MPALVTRGRSAVRATPRPGRWPGRSWLGRGWLAPGWLTRYWLALCALPAIAALIVLAASSAPDRQLLLPLLAGPP